MNNKNKRLSTLSDLEEFAFYGLPDFDDAQRKQYFKFEPQEWELIETCSSLCAKVYHAIQIGYFKAKNTFFKFSLQKIPQHDIHFILTRYFPNQALSVFSITKREYYSQQRKICQLFGYKLWSNDFLPEINDHARTLVRRDISPNFLANELLSFLKNKKIVRLGYTALQDIVSNVLAQERSRLKLQLENRLTKSQRKSLDQLLENDKTLSELASIKQDAKNFGLSMMSFECQKHHVLKQLYQIAKMILPHLNLSQQNINHYASLANHYSIYELDRFNNKEQTYLYLLCYVLKRYQLVNDTLADAFDFQVKKIEKEIKAKADLNLDEEKVDKQVGHLILLYVDDNLSDSMTLGDTRKKAFEILPKESIRSVGEKMLKKPQRKMENQWQEREKAAPRYKLHLRSLCVNIEFSSLLPNNPLLEAIQWMKGVFLKQQSLLQQPIGKFPRAFISKRMALYLTETDKDGAETINANRYEILVYRQIAQQMQTGAIHIEDSVRHRTFYHELTPVDKKEAILATLNIPGVKIPFEEQIDSLFKELYDLLMLFDHKLKKGKLKHFKYDRRKKEVIWTKPRSKKDKGDDETLFDKLPVRDIVDVLRYVNEECGFLSSLTPLKPRYNKQRTDDDQLIAVLLSQAFGVGNYKMAQTSDISYRALETTYEQHMRLATLKKANDIIANATARLSVFPHYTFDTSELYGALDGQKFETITPTAKARYSRKYYKKGRGVVAYTLLSNHVPIQSEIIGAHEHESHFAFDIWYRNTSLINPTIITGDMQSVNKANFAIFHWFGSEFRPRFTNLKKEMQNIFCPKDPSNYKDFLVKPVGQINQQLIIDEKENFERVIASLGSKEISQGILIKKLCSLSPHNKTRQAIFEYNNLIQSIYTLKCILDPKILIDDNRSQNRVESYHSLRAAISRVCGRKVLLGNTDLEVEISNQCGRLVACAVIYYSAAIQSHLYETTTNKKYRKIIVGTSPVARQHINFTGHFTFFSNKKPINLKNILENIEF
jgi:TnpA family transposase